MTTVLVTGANRGIGLEFVRQYAKEGNRVLATCRNPAAASELRKLADAGDVEIHPLDVGDGHSIDALAGKLRGVAIDVLINNAAVTGMNPGTIEGLALKLRNVATDMLMGNNGIVYARAGTMDYRMWEEVFRVNAIGPFRVALALRENLKQSDTRKVITISSGMGSTTNNGGGNYAYRASKAAVNNLMRGLAADWEPDRFSVVVISPGWVATRSGGRGAQLSAESSVCGMRKVIASLRPQDSGRFLDYRGDELPW